MDAALQQARYINLTTFRKDGRAVGTAVWMAPLGGKLYLYTSATAGKTKRIRTTSKVRVAPSDYRGKPIGGWSEGQGRIVSEAAVVRAFNDAMAKKYGLQHYMVRFLSWITRTQDQRIVIELTV
ncbi:MAG TPA: PPOX class F420-dependent oxidoreductase [bacterium]